MTIAWQIPLLMATMLYQLWACRREDAQPPPGQLIDVGGYRLHLHTLGEGSPTIVLDHSLGGLEGYLLIRRLAALGRVVICDRAGYGWSDHSPYPRTSQYIVKELHSALHGAQIAPPYILIGDSFGSYNVRLYAHHYPEHIQGLILTDGLHGQDMNTMPWPLQLLQLIFISGFIMSILGASLGLIRLLRLIGVFELIKPGLKKFSPPDLNPVLRSFCRPKHWITMTRELRQLHKSGQQLIHTDIYPDLPIVSIKSHSFFTPSLLTYLIPLRTINHLRNKMHKKLMRLSQKCIQIPAHQSSHFVWIDQPDLLVDAVRKIKRDIHTTIES